MPFCQVPLQDPDAACAELDRCLAAGHAGVEIGNHVGDRDLDDEGIVTFLQHCAQRGRPGLRAPLGHAGRRRGWTAGWPSGWSAMPAETHLSMLALILGGVFDRVPESLRICFAHGGGSFAFWLGRARERLAPPARPRRGTSEHPPSALPVPFTSTRSSSTTAPCACSSTRWARSG